MALTLTINSVDSIGNLYVFGTIAVSGSYPTGGDIIDFTTVAHRLGASQAALQVWASGSTGDTYSYVRGATPTMANGKLKISTTSNTELAAGAYAARFTGDTNIQFQAIFKKLI